MDEIDNRFRGESFPDDDRISAYLRGEMSDKDEALFLKQLAKDRQLRSMAIAMAYLAKAMKHVGSQRDEEIKEALLSTDEYTALDILEKATFKAHGIVLETAYYADPPKYASLDNASEGKAKVSDTAADERKSSHSSRFGISVRLPRRLVIAACVLLLGGLGYKYYSYRTLTSLGNEYSLILPTNQAPVRGAANAKAEKELTSLYNNVQNGDDLGITIKRLSILWELSTMDTYNDYTDDAPYIGWNLAIAYLKNGDRDNAKEVLSKLIAKTDRNSVLRITAVNLQRELCSSYATGQ